MVNKYHREHDQKGEINEFHFEQDAILKINKPKTTAKLCRRTFNLEIWVISPLCVPVLYTASERRG